MNVLTLIREFLGPSPSAMFGKIQKTSLVVSSQLGHRKLNYICRQSVSWAIV